MHYLVFKYIFSSKAARRFSVNASILENTEVPYELLVLAPKEPTLLNSTQDGSNSCKGSDRSER